MSTHHTPLHVAAAEAVARHAGVSASDLKVEQPPRAELGDLAVGCFAIAKAQGKSPAQAAQEIAAAFQPTELLASATAAGPFVNFKADRVATLRWAIDAALACQLVPPTYGAGKTICIDYSSPNISKHLAYHHLRGTTLGHALVKIYRALGYKVIGINFLGDWGTTHGMLIAGWNKWGPVEPLDVKGLNALYVKFREAMKDNPALEDEGRAWFKRLEDGDPDARALWQKFRDVSWAEFEDVYSLLGIVFEEVRGESAYEPDLPRVMKELHGKGLVVQSEGAEVVELEGEKTPILLRKKDGSTLYATRDVAAAQYRWTTYQFDRSLYVVGREQSLHFRQLFKLLKKAGHDWANRCQHVPYGLIRFQGKKTATRLGNVTLMRTVFDMMRDEVRPRIAENNPEMSPAEVDEVSRQVGIGAVVFANLATQREKDVDFDIEKVTNTSGDSGPYLQYAHARCSSIMRKAGEHVTSTRDVDLSLLLPDGAWAKARRAELEAQLASASGDEERAKAEKNVAALTQFLDDSWQLCKRFLELPELTVRAGEAAEPHVVCHYLLQLVADFSRWYTAGNGDPTLRVVNDNKELQRARLALTAGVQAVLATGLGMLGIAAPERL